MKKYIVKGRIYIDVYREVSAKNKNEALKKVKALYLRRGLKNKHWSKDGQDISEIVHYSL